jgi:hypothetical protein
MSRERDRPRSIEQKLLRGPRRTAGVDSHGEPVRLGERDSSGHIVGYVDETGLAWQSLTEELVATRAGRLAEAIQLPAVEPRREQLIEALLADLPDELILDVAGAAGELLALRELAEPDE